MILFYRTQEVCVVICIYTTNDRVKDHSYYVGDDSISLLRYSYNYNWQNDD